MLGWRTGGGMDASFCVDCLGDGLRHHGRLEVFDGDQSSRFTGDAFVRAHKRQETATGMNRRAWALDNIFVERLWAT